MICVLVLASGAAWESAALGHLSEARGVVVLKRCVDVDDLMATAATGQAQVAVVSLDAPGLDTPAVAHLRRHGVRPVGVVPDASRDGVAARLARLDVRAAVGGHELARLPEVVASVEDVADTRAGGARAQDARTGAPGPADDAVGQGAGGSQDGTAPGAATEPHRVVAVWGPAGAPGRTTLATAFAGELARRGSGALLVDVDPYAGSVAQHLGVLDEVSGLLSAARLAAGGVLGDRLPSVLRSVAPGLDVLTGLPRADRWAEVRAGAVSDILDVARLRGHVVVDTGFALEGEGVGDLGALPARNTMTLEALEAADDILVVGSADPVGLSRLARGLVDLREVTGDVPVRVVVNRMRGSLGWSPADIAGMVEGFARISGLHFLPDDRDAADRALVAGRALAECGETSLSRAVAELVDAVFPATYATGARRTLRRRRGGTTRRR